MMQQPRPLSDVDIGFLKEAAANGYDINFLTGYIDEFNDYQQKWASIVDAAVAEHGPIVRVQLGHDLAKLSEERGGCSIDDPRVQEIFNYIHKQAEAEKLADVDGPEGSMPDPAATPAPAAAPTPWTNAGGFNGSHAGWGGGMGGILGLILGQLLFKSPMLGALLGGAGGAGIGGMYGDKIKSLLSGLFNNNAAAAGGGTPPPAEITRTPDHLRGPQSPPDNVPGTEEHSLGQLANQSPEEIAADVQQNTQRLDPNGEDMQLKRLSGMDPAAIGRETQVNRDSILTKLQGRAQQKADLKNMELTRQVGEHNDANTTLGTRTDLPPQNLKDRVVQFGQEGWDSGKDVVNRVVDTGKNMGQQAGQIADYVTTDVPKYYGEALGTGWQSAKDIGNSAANTLVKEPANYWSNAMNTAGNISNARLPKPRIAPPIGGGQPGASVTPGFVPPQPITAPSMSFGATPGSSAAAPSVGPRAPLTPNIQPPPNPFTPPNPAGNPLTDLGLHKGGSVLEYWLSKEAYTSSGSNPLMPQQQQQMPSPQPPQQQNPAPSPLLPPGTMMPENQANIIMPSGQKFSPLGMQPSRNVGQQMPQPRPTNTTPQLDFNKQQHPLAV